MTDDDHIPTSPTRDTTVRYVRGVGGGWMVGERRATFEEVAVARPRCPHRARHWFTVYGVVGQRAPVCTSCGAPNPTMTQDERDDYVAITNGHPKFGRFASYWQEVEDGA